jgi:hypothetical protein
MLFSSYCGGFRLISDGLDFLGRFDAAHFAALSFACLASSAVLD